MAKLISQDHRVIDAEHVDPLMVSDINQSHAFLPLISLSLHYQKSLGFLIKKQSC